VRIGTTLIEDTFAEAFGMRYARLIITADDDHWLRAALSELTGYSASVIACDAETGVEAFLRADETPDGRTGATVLIFGFSADALANTIPNRVGQCVMTCPTTAVYNGLPDSGESIPLGKHIRYFGDSFQKSKKVDGRRYWRIPVMDGEFLVEEKVGVAKGVAGGNIILQADSRSSGLAAARRSAEAVAASSGVIAPFPGGVVRSGSKVGSLYPKLKASTNDAYCPTLAAQTESALPAGTSAVYEIVIDGFSFEAIQSAMRAGLHCVCACPGITLVSAGNYGGKLGPHHFHLRDLLE